MIAAIGLCGLLGILGLRLVRLETDALALLPRGGEAIPAFQRYVARFGALEHLYLQFEAPEGRAIAEYEGYIGELSRELAALPEIESVDAAAIEPGKDWSYLFDRVLLALSPARRAEALGRLSGPGLEAALAEARETLALGGGSVSTMVREDPLGFLRLLREELAAAGGRLDLGAALAGEEGYLSPDGTSRLVLVRPRLPPYDTEWCRALIARIEARASEGWAAFAAHTGEPDLPRPGLVLAGGYVVAPEAEALIHREVRANSISSLAAILLVVLLVYRSPGLLLSAGVTMGLAALLSLALTGLVGHRLLAASAGGSAMLFGLGIDGIVLLYGRWLETRAEQTPPELALRRMASTARGVFLGTVTTIASFAALLFIDFPTLQELGALIAVGMLLTFLLMLLVIPATLEWITPRRVRPAPELERLARFVARRPGAILLAALLVTLAFASALPGLKVSTTLEKLAPRTPAIERERAIVERFGLPRDLYIAIAEGPELEPLLEAQGRLEAALADADRVGVSSAARLLPSAAEQDRAARELAAAGADPAGLRGGIERAAAAAGFRPGSLDPFLARLERMLDPAARLTLAGYTAAGLGPVIGRFVAGGPSGAALAVYLQPRPGVDVERLASAARAAAPVFHLTGSGLVNRELEARFVPEFARGLALGGGVVALLLWLGFRRIGLTLLALLPTALGLLWAAGALAALGVELDLFSAFAVVMVVGVGVDYGIHVIHRHAIEGSQGVADTLRRLSPAILFAGATTVIGFGSVISSSYPPLRSMGIFASASMTACMLTNLLVLPALLVWRERR